MLGIQTIEFRSVIQFCFHGSWTGEIGQSNLKNPTSLKKLKKIFQIPSLYVSTWYVSHNHFVNCVINSSFRVTIKSISRMLAEKNNLSIPIWTSTNSNDNCFRPCIIIFLICFLNCIDLNKCCSQRWWGLL